LSVSAISPLQLGQKWKRGVAALCLGGGNAVALAVELA
jgi:acetyl-CoA acetyltransferase